MPTKPTITVPASPPVHITGSISTTKFFNREIEIESELKSVLESNDLVETAKVSVTGIKASKSNHRRRDYVAKIVEFIAACFVRNQTQLDLGAMKRVQQTLIHSIENSGSFSSANSPLVVAKPKIIKIKPLPIADETEIKTKIGGSKIDSDNTIYLCQISGSLYCNNLCFQNN